MEYVIARQLNLLYILCDIAFLAFLGTLLWIFKRRRAFWFGLIGGVAYFAVDYGIFYLALGTRVVAGADPLWFLLWLSASYGFTNFAWIWLWLDRDERLFEWSALLPIAWICIGVFAKEAGDGMGVISISRGSGGYHGAMALIMLAGYATLVVRNLRLPHERRAKLGWLLAIGVLVQFAWEFALLVTGIRPMGFVPIVMNSLLETNLGIPWIYLMHDAYTRKVGVERRLKE
jgi:hypothetical protein